MKREWNLSLARLILLTAGVAVVATSCAAAVHVACFHPPPPVSRPETGTPRGEYCAVLVPWHPWVSLTVGPCVLVVVAWLLAPRWRLGVVVLAALLCAALIANAVIVNNLTWALTIS